MTNPRTARSAAYAASWRSNARQAAPIERAAQSVMRAGSARITPMSRRLERRQPTSSSSVRLVEVAALEEVAQPEVLLDVEVELQEILHELRRRVALRS